MKQCFVWLTVAMGVVCLLTAGTAWSADHTDLSAQALKAKLDGGETIVVVNPLSDLEFNEGHIPGSVNIPLHLIPTTDQLPSDKNTPIVTYCLGPK